MKCHQIAEFVDGQEQKSDITVADQDFGIFSDQSVVKFVQNPDAPKTSPGADDGVDFWIGKHSVHCPGPALIVPGQIPGFLQ